MTTICFVTNAKMFTHLTPYPQNQSPKPAVVSLIRVHLLKIWDFGKIMRGHNTIQGADQTS